MTQEALKLALEALKEISRHATTPYEDDWCGELAEEAITAINALAQPEQEPWPEEPFGHMAGGVQPAQRPWVYLTEEHIKEIVGPYALPIIGYTRKLFDQIEAKSKELNNG